jgi:hypothetical protein
MSSPSDVAKTQDHNEETTQGGIAFPKGNLIATLSQANLPNLAFFHP